MDKSDTYAWHMSPVCDAFAPSKYPPPVIVNPDHVGYAIQRYVEGEAMGEVIRGYYRAEDAKNMVDRLNSGEQVSGLVVRKTYL